MQQEVILGYYVIYNKQVVKMSPFNHFLIPLEYFIP